VHLLSQEEGSEDLVLERLTTNHNAADKSEGKNNGALSAILSSYRAMSLPVDTSAELAAIRREFV
jgi:hypothetical protein